MTLNIRERSQAVLGCLVQNTQQSLRAIAAATGLSKSSVHRHLRRMKKRQRHKESHLWETPEGEQWLRRLVFGVIYCFGIKGGIGSQSLSAFFHLLRLEERIGCSASALGTLEVKLQEQIVAYEQAQRAECATEAPIGICLGCDETFFGGVPLLVAMELASGFILTEVECENRSYPTWWGQISPWFTREQWDCRGLVSDEAKALVKLALSGLGCASLPDVFHLLYGLSKTLGRGIARQQAQVNRQLQTLQGQTASTEAKVADLEAQRVALQTQQRQLETDHQVYEQSLHGLSQAIHPFDLETGQWQLATELASRLQVILATLEPLTRIYGQNSPAAVVQWQRQIPALSLMLQGWWLWVFQALACQTQDLATQNWVLTVLLPWVYWHQQTQKTRQPQLKADYAQAAQQAQARWSAAPFTHTLDPEQQQQWFDWALWMCAKFQRTSSAVEGRNGYLARLHHANRGLTTQTLQVLTVVHNFDLKRADGSTAAQRLFGKPFPDVFEWVVDHMGELPAPRKSRKPPIAKIPTVQAVPA